MNRKRAISDTQIHVGGVYRCCVNTVAKLTTGKYEPGDEMPCEHCSDAMLLGEDYIWRGKEVTMQK